ncbi:MAG: hypothetical protein WCT08_02815 [Patescibacteria group bacterium]|jgi:hypothetical protein
MSKKLLIILAGAVIITLALLVLLFVWQKKAPSNTNAKNTNAKIPNINTVIVNQNSNQNANTQPVDSNINDKLTVQQVARSFAGIYGSFSTQNDFQNITDLYFYMTPQLKAQQEGYVATERQNRKDNSLYRGITSEVRIVNLESFDAQNKTATVKISLQRVESSGSTSESTNYYQDITLSFEKQDGVWKVGKIVWGPKQ